jgi:hypothetical protein
MPQQAAEDQLKEQISEAINMEQTRRAAEDRLNEARASDALLHVLY